MTKGVREGLGTLCMAAVPLIIGAEASRGGSDVVADIGIGFGGLIALIGFSILAFELLRKQPD